MRRAAARVCRRSALRRIADQHAPRLGPSTPFAARFWFALWFVRRTGRAAHICLSCDVFCASTVSHERLTVMRWNAMRRVPDFPTYRHVRELRWAFARFPSRRPYELYATTPDDDAEGVSCLALARACAARTRSRAELDGLFTITSNKAACHFFARRLGLRL